MNSVMEEKSQRIAEVMLGSLKPFEFMMGKLIGGVSVSLTAAIFYVGLGTFAVRYYDVAQYVPFDVLPWFFVHTGGGIVIINGVLQQVGKVSSKTA